MPLRGRPGRGRHPDPCGFADPRAAAGAWRRATSPSAPTSGGPAARSRVLDGAVRARLAELLPDERVQVLENTRFDPGETKNEPGLARELADDHDPSCRTRSVRCTGRTRRRSASPNCSPLYAGLPSERELTELGKLLGDVERPFVLVLGGAKVEDKLGVLRHLGGRADTVVIGGKMGEELRDENPLDFEVELPVDVVAAAASGPTPSPGSCTTTRSPTAGSASTRAGRRRRRSPTVSGARGPSSGTVRWACSRAALRRRDEGGARGGRHIGFLLSCRGGDSARASRSPPTASRGEHWRRRCARSS